MVKFDVEGSQNVEVSRKIACEKPLVRQLEIMEKYTEVHKNSLGLSKEMRELNCLKVIYPEMFRSIEDGDLIAGRLDFLPIGFGTVTSVGGVGHYCVFSKLREFQREISEIDSSFGERVEKLYQYWLDHDLKTEYCRRVLTETTVGRFIDTEYPLIATARLSGMMLDYPKLLENGIGGLEKIIKDKLALSPDNEFYKASFGCLELVSASADCLAEKASIGELGSLSMLIKNMCYENYSSNLYKVDSVELYLQLFFIKLSEKLNSTNEKRSSDYYDKMYIIRSKIYSMPQNDWSIEGLAQQLIMSKSHFEHTYKKIFGISPMNEVINSRIEHAKFILTSTDISVKQIAEMCGYKSDIHFMRQFKSRLGVTPSVYRSLCSKNNK